MVDTLASKYTTRPFGENAEQQYLLHLQNIIHVQDIYKLVEEDNEYVNLLARHKIEAVDGWGCRLLFTRPKRGLQQKVGISIHNPDSGFKRHVDIAFIDIPCKIDKLYYDSVQPNRWIDALGSEAGVAEVETQLKENIGSEITEDINMEVENAFSDPKNYSIGTGDTYKKPQEVSLGSIMPEGNYYEIDDLSALSIENIIDFAFNISSKFKSRNKLWQKGYYADNDKGREDETAYEKLETNTPSLKRVGVVLDSVLLNKMSTEKLSQAFNAKYIDFKERFAWVKDTNFRNVLKAGKTHGDYLGYDKDGKDKAPEAFKDVYENKKCIMWIGDVRVPVLKIREPKEGLRYGVEADNGTRWFFLDSRVYIGLATCLNYVGLFANIKAPTI